MKSEFKYLNLIERFINNEMREGERKKFINKLSYNKRLAFEYAEYHNIINAISDKETIEVRRKILEILDNKSYNTSFNYFRPIISKKILSYAALILTFISITIVIKLIVFKRLSFDNDISYLQDYPLLINEESKKLINNNTFPISIDSFSNNPNIEYFNKDSIIDTSQSLNPDKNILHDTKYKLCLEYAELITSNFRSLNFNLIEPPDSIVYQMGESINISWEETLNDNIFLEIINKDGEIIFEVELTNQSYYILKNNFPKGIYLLKFRSNREILKFVVIFIN